MLDKALTLTDLTLFGVASIVGSGGFNLVGKAVRTGGSWWHMALLISATLLLGASYSYSEAFEKFRRNTSESDMVASVFGPVGEGVTIFAILLFNIVSISAILVFCAQLLLPDGSWGLQVGAALAALGGMAAFSLTGIEMNKVSINAVAYVLVGLFTLTSLSSLTSFASFTSLSSPSLSSQSKGTSFTTSLLLMFFILAGFDSNMKFAQEATDPEDVPRSFFTSNVLSILLVAGVAFAVQQFVLTGPGISVAKESNALGHLYAAFFGPSVITPTKYLMTAFMITTTFIVFLSTTRYLFGLGEKFSVLAPLKEVNAASVPYNTVAVVLIIAGLAILINHTETLVRMSDVGIILLLGLVAAAAAVADFGSGSLVSALVNGATASGFASLLSLCVL
jgi:amino acid transporter